MLDALEPLPGTVVSLSVKRIKFNYIRLLGASDCFPDHLRGFRVIVEVGKSNDVALDRAASSPF
jgi:hypothetical protein